MARLGRFTLFHLGTHRGGVEQLQSEVTNENVGNGLVLNYAKTITPNLVVTTGAGNWKHHWPAQCE
jgi:hypothetical protein